MLSSRKYCFGRGPEYSRDLFVRSCGEFLLVPPDRERLRTCIDFGEIFWPVSGQCVFFLDKKRFLLRPGQVWYYPPGSLHDYKPASPFHYCWMTVSGDDAAQFFSLLGISPGINRAGTCPQQLFSALGRDCVYHSRTHRINALATAFRIALEIAFPEPVRKNSGTSAMEYARNLIETSFDDPDLSAGQIAEVLHMHRASFSRAFSKAFSMTARDYITFVRLQNAARGLTENTLSIRETAEKCGFRSANYFSKVFLARMGVTPQKYRTQTASRHP